MSHRNSLLSSIANLLHSKPKHQISLSNTATLFLLLEIVLSTWSQNQYVRGSWSDPVVGTDYTVHVNMAGRLNYLFFGGEATHGKWYGFMQGAYYSGRDRANEIASCILSKKCEAYQPSIGLPVIADRRLPFCIMVVALLCLFVISSFLSKKVRRKCFNFCRLMGRLINFRNPKKKYDTIDKWL